MAEGIALCRPEVICAYPITPQTHIVEGLGEMVRSGELKNCEFINVESEFAALSVAIGASAAGARAYTATASQGLLFMAEAVYNASGLGLPIVMTLGNRAIGAPINIWNDHSDAMSMRDAGWMQLFAETNQEAVDLHIQAFRLAEELSMPVMVCVDGFILTHAVERIDIPDQADVDAFLPPYEPVQVLDPEQSDFDWRHGRARSLHRGTFSAEFQAEPGAPSASRVRRRVQGAIRTRVGRAASHLPDRRRGAPRRRHGIGQRHDQGHDRRNASRRLPCRSRHARIVPPVPHAGAARGTGRGETRRGDRKELRHRHGRAARQQRRSRARAILQARRRCIRSSPGSAAVQSRGRRCTSCSAARWYSRGKGRTFSTSTRRSSPRNSTTFAKYGAPGPTAENILRHLSEAAPRQAAE